MYKRLIISLIIFLTTGNYVLSDTRLPSNTTIVAAAAPIIMAPSAMSATYNDCIKNYTIASEALFYACLSAINDANYQIQEIQFKSGTIIFKAYSKDFIVMVAKKDSKNSFIKIVPCDNIYNFSPTLLAKIFNYIDVNQKSIIQNLI